MLRINKRNVSSIRKFDYQQRCTFVLAMPWQSEQAEQYFSPALFPHNAFIAFWLYIILVRGKRSPICSLLPEPRWRNRLFQGDNFRDNIFPAINYSMSRRDRLHQERNGNFLRPPAPRVTSVQNTNLTPLAPEKVITSVDGAACTQKG